VAAQVLARFSHLVRQAVGEHNGRAVKQIGDAFMLVFSDAGAAVACILDLERRTTAEPQFPALRSAIHWGEVLYREGDYVGANVNLVARLADAAARHEILVTAAVKDDVASLPDAGFVPRGWRALKGIAENVEVFAVVAHDFDRADAHRIDPVCGIEIRTSTATARLTLDGAEQIFCCMTCLQRFVEAPERYRGGAAGQPQ